MRTVVWFVLGISLGAAIQGSPLQQGRWLLGLNHVAMAVPDFDGAVKFYTNAMGMKEAFTFREANGTPILTYLQISQNTFLELQPSTPTRPPGLIHIGLEVDDLPSALAQFRQGGLKVQDPTVSARTNARISQASDSNGLRFELLEFGPGSLQRKVMDSWK